MLQEHGLEARREDGIGEGWEIDGEEVEGELERDRGESKGKEGGSENIMVHSHNGNSKGHGHNAKK